MTKYCYNLEKDKVDQRDYKFSIEKVQDIPLSMDLRSKMPFIFDQGTLGSCTANAGVAARMVLDDIKTLLSRLFLYYEERKIEGTVSEDSGASIRDICKALRKNGVCEEKFLPYDTEKYTESPSEEAIINAKQYKINAYKRLTGVNQIKNYIAENNQGVLIGIEVYESFEDDAVAATGKIPIPDVSSEQYLGGHAVYIVGYKDFKTDIKSKCVLNIFRNLFTRKKIDSKSKGYFIVRNSWGAFWGDNGYFYLPYEYIEKGYAYDFWVLE